MARAIDANELEMFPYSEGAGTEEQIEDWIEQVGLSGDDTASRARNLCWKVIDGCINVVKTQPTLTQPNPEEVKQMRWIPVEERKPKPSDNPILIYKSWDGRANFIGTAWYSSFHGWIPTNGTKIYGVTHWMPLPPPPT